MPEPSIYGVVLASGESKRFGTANKLTARVDSISVIRRTVNAYLAALESVFVVVGHEADLVRQELADMKVWFVSNPDFADGQASSLRLGVLALPKAAQAAVIGVGDQPLLKSDVIKSLIANYEETQAPIIAPTYGGRRGNPVLFAARLFTELTTVRGDVGGRGLFARHAVESVAISDVSIGTDIDEPADLEAVERRLRTIRGGS